MMKRVMLGSASLFMFMSHAAAQQAAPPVDVPLDEEIIVTGTALARQNAIEEKKNSDQIIEALGVDELGQLPDKNIGETLNRLPGVSMLVEKGEGRYVQIRGVNSTLNNVTINGVQMGSPEAELGGRQAPLDMISGSLLGGVQVIKTPTPDMDGQGIGGTVNVDTQMPFDRADPLYGYLTGRYGYEETRPRGESYGGHDPYGVDGLISGKVGTNFGWLAGASYTAREYVSVGVYQDDWTRFGAVSLPINVKNNYYIIGRERLNLSGAVEWQPSDHSSYFARGFYATWDEYQHRNRYEQNLSAGVVPTNATSGVSGPNRVLANVRLEEAYKTIASIALGGEHDYDRWSIDYLVQVNQNELDEPNDNWEFRSSAVFGPNTYTVDGDGIVTIRPNAGTPNRQDPNLIALRRVRFFDSSMEEQTTIASANFKWRENETLTLKGGVKFAETDRTLDNAQTEYAPGTPSTTLGTSASFTNGAFTNDTPSGAVPNIWLDIDGMNQFFANPANASRFVLNTASTFTSGLASDYDITERVVAGYGMATVDFGKTQVITGLRVESTEVDSSGFLLRGTTAQRVNAGGDYVKALPAFLLNHRPNEAWVMRAAVTRALGRPEFDQIAPRSTFSDAAGAVGNLTIGNPDLKPRTSWNYDAAIEWYPNTLSAVAVSVFRKEIANELVALSEGLTTQADMQRALAERGLAGFDTSALSRLNVTTTVNAGNSYLQGIEVTGQTQFSFLPGFLSGFGVSGTATFIEGETTVNGVSRALVGQPERTYSFTGFFQQGPIDASVSYAYNASYLTDLSTDPAFNLDQGEFGRWDAKVSYKVGDAFKVFLEGVNLNDEPTSEFQGGIEKQNTEFEYVGRTVYLGVTYGF